MIKLFSLILASLISVSAFAGTECDKMQEAVEAAGEAGFEYKTNQFTYSSSKYATQACAEEQGNWAAYCNSQAIKVFVKGEGFCSLGWKPKYDRYLER